MSIKARENNQDSALKPTLDRRHHEQALSQQRAQRFIELLHMKASAHKTSASMAKSSLKKLAQSRAPTTESTRAQIVENVEPFSSRTNESTMLTSNANQHHISPEYAIERDPTAIVQTAIASGRADDINLLIKKLTLNFSTKQSEAHFTITTGVFEGAHFLLKSDDRDLNLKISNASDLAQRLLIEHQQLLKNTLASKEINLRDLAFLS